MKKQTSWADYDTAIRNASTKEDDKFSLKSPDSCKLYDRHTRHTCTVGIKKSLRMARKHSPKL